MNGQLHDMNARRRPVLRPAEDVTLVESLRFAVPLWIVGMRDANHADLVRAGLRCAWAVGERGDNLMFHAPGEPTKSGRDSAIIAFQGLARGLAAICLLEGRANFAGLHWCVREHENCAAPRPIPAPPVPESDVQRVVALLDEFEALLGDGPVARGPSPASPVRGARAVEGVAPSGEWADAL